MKYKDEEYTTKKILKENLKYIKILSAQRDETFDETLKYLFKLNDKYGGLK